MANQINTKELDFSKVIDANRLFPEYCGTENLYKYGNFVLTDGVHDVAQETGTFWFIDIIISHHSYLKHAGWFLCWTLEREMEVSKDGEVESRSDVFNAICDDGNGNVLRRQKIPFVPDCPFDTYSVWIENETILLPSEH